MKKSIFTLIMFVSGMVLFLTGCKKNDDPVAELTTTPVTYVSHNGAVSGGTFIGNANNSTAQGICWGTSADPTINDNHSEEMYGSSATGGGTFTVIINNLLANTTYYVRAYCTNKAGTGYGNGISFKTLDNPPASVSDIDGNTYNTVVIGNQVWLQKNLNVLHYTNGDSIKHCVNPVDLDTFTDGRFTEVGLDSNNAATFGRLYNYFSFTDTRKIAPAGWHVPSQAEWDFLENYLGGNTVAGGKLKETGTVHWGSPNTGADNSTGFTGLPAGWYASGMGSGGAIFWSSSIYEDGSNNNVWIHGLVANDTKLTYNRMEKTAFLSIRLVRDYAK
jgi:uncharacterized protein (TIGR02145 family)